MMTQKLFANWKMNKTPSEAKLYIQEIKKILSSPEQQKYFVFLAPAVCLSALQKAVQGTEFGWGAQNSYFKDAGAFTGETSPQVLKQMGVTHCLVGHSERRQFFSETDEWVQKKGEALLKHSIQPVICVGESWQEREKGLSFQVIKTQLKGVLSKKYKEGICIAYEPCWAIGTQQAAGLEQIIEMQKFIHRLCESQGLKLYFLYGGSVNQDNVKDLAGIPELQGFLIGGASLDPKVFYKLFQVAYEKK